MKTNKILKILLVLSIYLYNAKALTIHKNPETILDIGITSEELIDYIEDSSNELFLKMYDCSPINPLITIINNTEMEIEYYLGQEAIINYDNEINPLTITGFFDNSDIFENPYLQNLTTNIKLNEKINYIIFATKVFWEKIPNLKIPEIINEKKSAKKIAQKLYRKAIQAKNYNPIKIIVIKNIKEYVIFTVKKQLSELRKKFVREDINQEELNKAFEQFSYLIKLYITENTYNDFFETTRIAFLNFDKCTIKSTKQSILETFRDLWRRRKQFDKWMEKMISPFKNTIYRLV